MLEVQYSCDISEGEALIPRGEGEMCTLCRSIKHGLSVLRVHRIENDAGNVAPRHEV